MSDCYDCKYNEVLSFMEPCKSCVRMFENHWEARLSEHILQSKITNCLRMIAGAQSSPDFPANLPALLEELKEELERAA